MFVANAASYCGNLAFRVKMILLVLAGLNMLVFELRTFRSVAAWDIDQPAPVAGRVADVAPLHTGDVVGAGQKFATVIPAGELMVVADFEPTAVLGRVRPGQAAQLRLEVSRYMTMAKRSVERAAVF